MRTLFASCLAFALLGCPAAEPDAGDPIEDPTPDDGPEVEYAYDGFDYASHWFELSSGDVMHYLDEGDGDPIVLVHGVPTQAYMWRNVIPALAEGYRVIAPDHLNFGLSDQTDLVDAAGYMDTLAELLVELDLTDVTLVLHDWGVPIGLNFAATHPERVAGVVFFEGPWAPFPSIESVPPPFIATLLDPATSRPGIVDDNYFVECFLLDPACGGSVRDWTDAEREVYRAPFETVESREQLFWMPQYLPFVDTTGHPGWDADGPGGEAPQPTPHLDRFVANFDWLSTADTPKRFLYGSPGLLGNGNGAGVAAQLEGSIPNLTSAQVGDETVPSRHFIAEDAPQDLANAILDFLEGA